jgi:hypothetical protein
MRTVDWTIRTHKDAIAALVLYFIVSGIQPAAVNCPLSASLVGRSSHVKLSVRSIARSIVCSRKLRQRTKLLPQNQNVGKQSKTTGCFWISYCEIISNEIFVLKIF